MTLNFAKYQATGNDFILLNGFGSSFNLSTEQIKFLCNRHFGIGADGLIIIRPNSQADFFMEFFNPDGSIASFCGNGGRTAVRFAYELGIINQNTTFSALDGLHKAQVIDNQIIKLQLKNSFPPEKNPFGYFINTGTEHLVLFVDKNLENLNIIPQAKKIRYHKIFAPNGTNVNFVQIIDDKTILVRTYEKGVENETLSCGTGTTAAALTFAFLHHKKPPIYVITKGGKLTVDFSFNQNTFKNVFLIGPAIKVFTGSITL